MGKKNVTSSPAFDKEQIRLKPLKTQGTSELRKSISSAIA
jgi:hypothetical protein